MSAQESVSASTQDAPTSIPATSSGSSSGSGTGQMHAALRGHGYGVQMSMLAPRTPAREAQEHAGVATRSGAPMSGAQAAPVQQRASGARGVQMRAVQRVVQRDTPSPPASTPGDAAAPGAQGQGTTTPATSSTESAGTAETPAIDPAVALQQKKQAVQAVTTPPIAQASDEPPTNLNADGSAFESMHSDSPDPIMLKNQVITLTQQYLGMGDDTEEAVKQAKLDEIKSTFEELRTAMKRARGEEDSLVALRVGFESFIGAKARGEWTEGTTCIDRMVETAKSMIAAQEAPASASAQTVDERLAGLPQDVKERIGKKIGTVTNIGFAGVVGQSFDTIIQALDSGSHVQRAQGLIGFADGYLVPGLLQGSGAVFDIAKGKLAEAQPEMDLAKMVEDAQALNDEKAAKKLLLSVPGFLDKMAQYGIEAKELNELRQEENGGVPLNKGAVLDGMDTKIPEQPIEVCSEGELDFIAGEVRGDKYPTFNLTDYRALSGKEAKLAYLKGAGIRTSKPNGAAVDATSTVEGQTGITVLNQFTQANYNYIEGKLENIVDPRHSWIMDANEAQMPLKAGISGTTARFAGTANLLGGSTNGAVVAMLGHLQAIEAHSFWEIVDAAGIGMSAGKYVPFPPNDAGMRGAAGEFLEQSGYGALGPMDKADAQKVLLGEKGQGG